MIGAITPELAALLTSQDVEEGVGRLAAGRARAESARLREDALLPDCDPYLRQLMEREAARDAASEPLRPARRRLQPLA